MYGMIRLGYKGNGWSEKYWLGDLGGHTDALNKFLPIVHGRRAFMGIGVEILQARVSNADNLKDAALCQLNYPLAYHPSFLPTTGDAPANPKTPNEDIDGILVRFENDSGRWANRIIRGVPDHWIVDKRNQYPIGFQMCAVGALKDMNPDTSGNAPTHLEVCQSFWRYLQLNSPHRFKNNSNVLVFEPWQSIFGIRVSSRRVGRPFGQSRGRRPSNLVS